MNIGSIFSGSSAFGTKSLGDSKIEEKNKGLSSTSDVEESDKTSSKEEKEYKNASEDLSSDNNDLSRLMSALKSGDMSVVEDIKSFHLSRSTASDDSLTALYHENLSTLSQLQAYATAYSENESPNGKFLNEDG